MLLLPVRRHHVLDAMTTTISATAVNGWVADGFAQSGKAAITVRQVLMHTAGILCFPEYEALLHWDGSGWDDYDAIAAGFAAAEPCWEPGARCGYHAMSYGWLVGELVRRITGQT